MEIDANFNTTEKTIDISQTITYVNTSEDTLTHIYLNDWNHSYASKKTALAERLAEEYISKFHLAKDEERGFTAIEYIAQNNSSLNFKRLKDQIDVIKVELSQPLLPKASYTIKLKYKVKIADDKFTGYGYTKANDFNLRYWYITPAVYYKGWQYSSNKNLNDLFIPKSNLKLQLSYPETYKLTSELNIENLTVVDTTKTITLSGLNRISNKLYLSQDSKFRSIKNTNIEIVSDVYDSDLSMVDKVLVNDKVINYILDNLGNYPHEKLLLSEIDNRNDPVYGLNALPSFLKPYSDSFQYELKLLKVALRNYLENTLLINPRKDQWLFDGVQVYFLMKYVDQHYPDVKFLGKLAKIWGVRAFHAADLFYNEKYTIGYMSMARSNRDQPLLMQKDSLLKFNSNIANKYKAGIGLKYLDAFVNQGVVEKTLATFLQENKLEYTSTKDFETFIKSKTEKDIDWFFTDYLKTRKKIDFKIRNVVKTKDSIQLTIKNKRDNSMPISLYALNNDSIISKHWVENIIGQKTITIPRNTSNKLVLNYNGEAPEFNLRDNWKSLKGVFFNNKPLQFKLFKDVEDPYYNQVFFMPIVEFSNIYDGLNLGIKVYNGTLLKRNLKYKIQPQYSVGSQALTGSVSAFMTHNIENSNLFAISYGARFGRRSFAEDLFVRRFTPGLSFVFRDDKDFRANKRRALRFRYLDIDRDQDFSNPDRVISNVSNDDEPDYSVFNARYIHSNDNLINFSKWYVDYQLSRTFSKLSLNYEYRRLFQNNRQLNVRFFGGTFLNNDNPDDSDFFSFALDRPTDYLFEYNYLGRSEDTGIFSQQFIEAEGGFKSRLNVDFANQWIATTNVSTTLWRYILAYGDLGLVKNRRTPTEFVYDSGIRVNLVTDYFELYFPVYSNLGFEINQPNYEQRIRFKFTVDPESLLGLFKRRWF